MSIQRERTSRPDRTRLARLGGGAVVGLLAAAAALGIGELVAAFTGVATAPELAVGSALITLAPGSVKDFAVREFGMNDKLVLVGGLLAVVVAFGVIGAVAAASAPVATMTAVVRSLAAAIIGAITLVLLLRAHLRTLVLSTSEDGPPAGGSVQRSRQVVLITGGAVAVVATATAITGRAIQLRPARSTTHEPASVYRDRPGGPYVGTARWLGVPLTILLNKAGVQRGAQQLLSRSIDGMTIGTPTEIVTDVQGALLAIATPGSHQIEVHAIDGRGQIQPETRTAVFPAARPAGSPSW